ncbi:MAG: bifunctional phosphoribosylaminoimidazolecarboxamide formyltransferase/IMP cyclohydrolase [Pirellulaceae bacterium]|nr:bifunctional phosphoribosylaminoimidazolecarboxamide formyltransferase/IMP cyclohydrolase [Pirellulaceae bacterium]
MSASVMAHAEPDHSVSADPLIKQALISVSDKSGLEELARGLVAAGVTIYSTGGTAKFLQQHLIPVRDVAQYTGFPEMMDGRVKTLHPKIFAGILCRHHRADDLASMDEHGILPFALVVVNLYPFEETIRQPEVTIPAAVEQIDIGGPSLVRAAAKNHRFTTICTSPKQYSQVLSEIRGNGSTTLKLRQRLMTEAFAHTAAYDAAISNYFQQQWPAEETKTTAATAGVLPNTLHLTYYKQAELRYGENPHQSAAVYDGGGQSGPSIVTARQLNGKELSYNNILDLDAAFNMVRLLPDPAVVVLKHNNPCGAAANHAISEATRLAMEGDPVSAFGSILGFNRTMDVASAQYLCTPGLFVEAIVAPEFEPAALELLLSVPKWKSNVRLMTLGPMPVPQPEPQIRQITGGLLVQQTDVLPIDPATWETVTTTPIDESLRSELLFAWAMVRQVKSNAITLSQDRALVGVGAGQMSRVDSVRIAIEKAGLRAAGSILASDAFFPFPDSVEQAAAAGVRALIQPGGSRRDEEVIAACNRHGMPMIFTKTRHFKH